MTRSLTSGFRPSIRSVRMAEGMRGGGLPGREGLDPNRLTRAHVAALLLDHDEAIRGRHRGQDARALGARGAHLPPVLSKGQDAALEFAAARPLAHALRGHGAERGHEELAPTGELPESRPHEEVEGQHGGDRIARQAEEVRAANAPDGHRPSRLHGHLPEVDAPACWRTALTRS